MNLSPLVRRVVLGVSMLLVLGLTWTGLIGGIHQLPESQTLGQQSQTVAQLAYGIFGLLAVITTFWGRRWRLSILACWAIALTLAAGFAPVVWGGTSVTTGFLSGGAGLLIAVAIAWLLRAGSRVP